MDNYLKYVIKLLFIIISIKLSEIKCDDGEGTKVPSFHERCTYTLGESIECFNGTEEVDIELIFKDLEEVLAPDQHTYELRWSLPVINRTLPENVFRNFRFNDIYWHGSLQKIHSNAFSSALGFSWWDRETVFTQLRNYPETNYDLYKAFSKIKDPKTIMIKLDPDYMHEIPDYAFNNTNWTNIELIGFQGTFNFSRIGNNIIRNLPSSLTTLAFNLQGEVVIKSIGKDAFKVEPCLDCTELTIAIFNAYLTDDALEVGVFNITGRPIILSLRNNGLTHLREKLFKPFFENNENNKLGLDNNPLECTPESKLTFKWLLQKPEYKDRVWATCADGTPFWDIDWESMEFPLEKVCTYQLISQLDCRGGTEEVDIEEVFASLRKLIQPGMQYFLKFYWMQPIKDGILPANVFDNFPMTTVYLGSSNLEKIHSNSTDESWQFFHLLSQSKVRNFPGTEFDFYQALIKMKSLNQARIILDLDYEHDIPDNAFENNQWTSPYISFGDSANRGSIYNISRIGNNLLYHLPDSSSILFIDVRIKSIAPDAFKLKSCENCNERKISLFFANNELSEQDLQPGLFDMGEGIVSLKINTNRITLLRENVFHQFLLNNKQNTINISGNPLECSAETKPVFDWIINKPEYENRITGATCANGTDIWDIDWSSWDFPIHNYCSYEQKYLMNCTLSSEEVDIEELFVSLEKELSPDNRNFDILIWTLPIKGRALPPNVFRNFSFTLIQFDSPNLEKIHIDAFSEFKLYANISWYMSEDQPSYLRNYAGTEYDLYEAFSKIKTIYYLVIILEWNSKHDIPDNAFKNNNWPALDSLQFGGNYTLSKIGDYLIYHLPSSITFFFIEVYNIEFISKNAFQLANCSACENLELRINASRLTNDILEPGVFDISGRPISLYLEYNQLNILKEEIFHRFLLNHDQNVIVFTGNPLECNLDTKHEFNWLLNKPEYKYRVNGTDCGNNTSIWDFDWNNKPTETTTLMPVIKCNYNGEYNGYHNITLWPPVEPGDYSVVNCPFGKGKIKWLCKENLKFDENGPSFEECWLDDLVDKEVESVEEVVEILDQLDENLSNDSSLNFISSLNKVIKIVENLNEFLQNNTIDSEVAENITTSLVQVFSDTIAQTNAWNNGTGSEREETASQILFLIQKTAFTTNCYLDSENNTKVFETKNLYQKHFYGFTEDISFEYNSSSMNIPNISDFEDIEEEDYVSCKGNTSFGSVIHNLNNYLNESLQRSEQMNSEIIAFSLRNTNKTQPLKEGHNVRIILKHRVRLDLGDRIECKFWDFQLLLWSSQGCRVLIKDSDRDKTVCECNHLTNFAAIMDLSGREEHDFTKEVLTEIFCSLSVASLVITILITLKKDFILKILLKLKIKIRSNKLKRTNATNTSKLLKRRDQIIINQSICLLVANLIIMLGMDKRDNTNDVSCYVISFLLLYFLLSTFVWMLLNGIHLFRMTHNVFDIAIKNVVLILIGYALPLIICLIGLSCIWLDLGFFHDALIGSDYFCWISSPKHPQNIWVLIGPALFVMVANIAIIGYLSFSVAKLKTKKNSRQVLGFLLLVVNLGLTWSLFVSYMHRISVSPQVFSYLFIVINGSQGVFILVYQLAIIINSYLAKRTSTTVNEQRTSKTD